MKNRLTRYYPVEHDNTGYGITDLKIVLYHSVESGFRLTIIPVKRENGFESAVLSLRIPEPSMYLQSGRYTAKRYETVKANIDSLIATLLQSWSDIPYEYNSCVYTQTETQE
jgi:hypothetical protein